MLVTYLEASQDLCETDSILFGAALAVCGIICAKLSTAGRATGQSSAIPAWRIRIEERIAKARALIGRLICFRSGNTRPRIVRTVRMAFAGTNVGTRNRANEEYIGRGDCGNAQYASRKSTATSPYSPKQAESGCREGSEPNAGDLFGSQPGPLRYGLNFFRAALEVCRIIGARVSTAEIATCQSSAIPAWRRRIEERIEKARALIGRLMCFRSGNNRPIIMRTVRMAFAETKCNFVPAVYNAKSDGAHR
ncbi:unnamed protein product [Parnassius apollo]|uniref:(apollo) hypothetical protein n=1 Tax=Parnassius apollo TaxID=110799 RepID=A0A8S3X939_PARAO|nr:unnamed protein product [Parnassius apollo]